MHMISSNVKPPRPDSDDVRHEYLGYVTEPYGRDMAQQFHVWGVRYKPDEHDDHPHTWRASHVTCTINRYTISTDGEDFLSVDPLPNDTGCADLIGVKTWAYLRGHAAAVDALIAMARRWCAENDLMLHPVAHYAPPAADRAA